MGLVFYDCETAPSPRRARMVITEKRAPVEVVNIDLGAGEQFSEAFRAVNPACTVPCLKLETGEVLTDNAGIARYLEEVFPDPALMGADPLEKARVAEWTWRVEFEGLTAVMEVLRNKSKRMVDRALPGPHPTPQIPQLVERGAMRLGHFWPALNARLEEKPWLAGEHFSVADIAAFVLVEFSAWVKLAPGEDFAALHRFHEAVKARPSGQV